MADANPQSQGKIEPNVPASPMPQDYYSVLLKVIWEASKDPAQLRKLVYALAWHNLKPDSVLSRPLATATDHARTIAELERALELERAIERLEADIARQPQKLISPPVQPSMDNRQPKTEDMTPSAARWNSVAENPKDLAQAASPPTEQLSALTRNPATEDMRPFAAGWNSAAQPPKDPVEQSSPPPESPKPAAELPPAQNAVIIVPERPPAWLEQTEATLPDRLPPWLDHRIRVSLDSVNDAPIRSSRPNPPGFRSLAQLIGAAVLGVALYVGISGWVYMGRQSGLDQTKLTAPPPQAPVPSKALDATTEARTLPPPPEPQPLLPFPLPKTYGVYAGSNGQLTKLEPLPINIPDPAVLTSAEITNPSRATVAGDKVTFVVFRRDLVNSAPQTASVRVVARVAHELKVVGGQVKLVPIEGSWRVRNKAYDFKVSPLQGHREMTIIQPDPEFVFPPGRYALVLNGFGYDFTVPGKVTLPEQCLEQIEALNGAVFPSARSLDEPRS